MSKIAWTEKTWNPIVGCSKVSAGCKNCYAEKMAKRLKAMGQEQYEDVVENGRWTGKLVFVPSMLEKPLRKKKATVYFLGSMTDVFHELVPEDWLKRIWTTMRDCPQHKFFVLTKRAISMREWANYPGFDLPNVGVGVTVENGAAMTRLQFLRETPAAMHFLSLEPLIGPVDLRGKLKGIDWVIAGGESGPGARSCNPEWISAAQFDCAKAGVAFFFKQWGGAGKDKGGNILHGQVHQEYPAFLKGENQ